MGSTWVIAAVFVVLYVIYRRRDARMLRNGFFLLGVLGSKIIDGRVPPLLRSRLDKGLEVYRARAEGRRVLIIPSGGQVPSAFLREFVAVVVDQRRIHALLLGLPFLAVTALLVVALLARS